MQPSRAGPVRRGLHPIKACPNLCDPWEAVHFKTRDRPWNLEPRVWSHPPPVASGVDSSAVQACQRLSHEAAFKSVACSKQMLHINIYRMKLTYRRLKHSRRMRAVFVDEWKLPRPRLPLARDKRLSQSGLVGLRPLQPHCGSNRSGALLCSAARCPLPASKPTDTRQRERDIHMYCFCAT